VARIGDRIALGMVALKLTAPGVPDIYQGDELAYRALVDPDNRRPVDWRLRESLLARLLGGSPPTAQTRKLWLISRLLGLRIRRPGAFTGGYEPVSAGEHAVAYLRGGEVLTVVATRPGAAATGPNGPAARLARIGGRWRSVLGGEERSLDADCPLDDVLDEQGIAVYERI
jgi:(1->4)-alpha-D-glucan 1-alpha-D-glucosylmutase